LIKLLRVLTPVPSCHEQSLIQDFFQQIFQRLVSTFFSTSKSTTLKGLDPKHKIRHARYDGSQFVVNPFVRADHVNTFFISFVQCQFNLFKS